jgi:competence protein ComEC
VTALFRRADTVSTPWMIVVAVGAVAGAWSRHPLACAVVILVVVSTALVRSLVLFVAAAFVLGSVLGARAWDGAAPWAAGAFDGVVTLRADPQRVGSAGVVTASTAGRRVEMWVSGPDRATISGALAGERFVVVGQLGGLRHAERDRARHLVARLRATRLRFLDQGSVLSKVTNEVRRVLAAGARPLREPERSLYLGMVVGDDRNLPARTVADFRASGLAHLTAVSGENVAFFLALVRALIRRCRPAVRVGCLIAAIGWFVVLTRAEPSVLRAASMAALTTLAMSRGRQADPIRLLALSVIALVFTDPLLVHAVGFWLSVGACASIATLAAPLQRRLPGPALLTEPLAVSLAAQIGVLPLSLFVFGSVPWTSPVANLLAVPLAGPIMTWGLTAGFIAGFVGEPVRSVIQSPIALPVHWVAAVAAAFAR